MTAIQAAHPSRWRQFLASLSSDSVGITVGLAVTVAVMLNPIFITPFSVLLGRTLFVGMVLLLVFAAMRLLPPAWLPRWLPLWVLQVVALAVAAPACTALVYVISTGGVQAFVGKPERVAGFMWIAGAGLVLGLIIAAAALVRERLADAARREMALQLDRSRLEKQAVDARLALLQAQIEPHFLFNTLANVQALVESGSPRAPALLQSLIAYLRAAMPRLHDQQATLEQELALVRAYLQLMQMRMPDRLQFSVQVDAALLQLPFPPMALLTLVENAVRHGIDPSEDGGSITVDAQRAANGQTTLRVADSGIGMSEHAQPGTGLTNLRARIAAALGPQAALSLLPQQPHGLRAEITWPTTAPGS